MRIRTCEKFVGSMYTHAGVDPGFSEEGGGGVLAAMRSRMAMARERVRERGWKLLPCVLNICS